MITAMGWVACAIRAAARSPVATRMALQSARVSSEARLSVLRKALLSGFRFSDRVEEFLVDKLRDQRRHVALDVVARDFVFIEQYVTNVL